ncbi:response regulator transcription factor [Shewanella sp. YIC-542]|uniref:response regulator transcription factor n=1 Tax=Shewanella mytili TaxID=3377111 RepID=UPI00398E64E4
MQQHNVYLVDDDAAIRDSLSFMLTQFGFQLQAFADGMSFLEQCQLQAPGCVILDARMPEITGQELQQRLLQQDSPLAIIFLTGHGDLPMAVEAFRRGACDFFQKPVNGKALAGAIEKALENSQKVWEEQQLQGCFNRLSPREKQVLQLLIQGQTNKQMSEALHLSLRTVEVHRANTMKKLGVHSLGELMKYTPLC